VIKTVRETVTDGHGSVSQGQLTAAQCAMKRLILKNEDRKFKLGMQVLSIAFLAIQFQGQKSTNKDTSSTYLTPGNALE